MTNEQKLSFYNKLIRFVNNKIEYVLSREGELPASYFKEDCEARLNDITGSIKTVDDIVARFDEIKQLDHDLRDGYKGLQVSGRY
jgi:hypothetical protein